MNGFEIFWGVLVIGALLLLFIFFVYENYLFSLFGILLVFVFGMEIVQIHSERIANDFKKIESTSPLICDNALLQNWKVVKTEKGSLILDIEKNILFSPTKCKVFKEEKP